MNMINQVSNLEDEIKAFLSSYSPVINSIILELRALVLNLVRETIEKITCRR